MNTTGDNHCFVPMFSAKDNYRQYYVCENCGLIGYNVISRVVLSDLHHTLIISDTNQSLKGWWQRRVSVIGCKEHMIREIIQ